MTTLYLCGAGNCEAVRLAIAIQRLEGRWERIVLLDDDVSKHGQMILGIEVIGPFSLLEDAPPDTTEIVNLVGRTTIGRWSAQQRLASFNLRFASLIHPDVDLSGVEIGGEIIVYQNVVVGPMTTILKGSVIFMGAILGNGSKMGRYCVLAPNAVINARVQLGDGAYIGTNAAVLPDSTVGAWATVGACTAVLKRVPPGVTVMGVPAKTVLTMEQKLRFSKPPAEIRRQLETQAG